MLVKLHPSDESLRLRPPLDKLDNSDGRSLAKADLQALCADADSTWACILSHAPLPFTNLALNRLPISMNGSISASELFLLKKCALPPSSMSCLSALRDTTLWHTPSWSAHPTRFVAFLFTFCVLRIPEALLAPDHVIVHRIDGSHDTSRCTVSSMS